jgi:hypothetical protein
MFLQANGMDPDQEGSFEELRKSMLLDREYGIPLQFKRLDKTKACNNRENYLIINVIFSSNTC